MTAAPAPNVQTLLIPFQHPESELQMLVQICAARGLAPVMPSSGQRSSGRFTFRSQDGKSEALLTMVAELGVFRLLISGVEADALAQLIANYLPTMTATTLQAQLQAGGNLTEQRLYAVFAILAYPDGDSAMRQVGQRLMNEGPDELREGVVQGLVLLQTPDIGPHLENIIEQFGQTPAGKLASKAYDQLAERGMVRRSAGALLKQARGLLSSDPEQALALLEEAEESNADPSELALVRASALRLAGQHEEALATLQRITSGPHAAASYVERALVLEHLEQVEDALADIRQALALDPGLEAARASRARLELRAGSSETPAHRRERLDAAIAERGDDAGLRVQRAELRLLDDDASGALEDLAAAAKADPGDVRIAVLRADAELRLGRYGEALRSACSSKAQAQSTWARRAAALKGCAQLALDEPSRALASFAELARKDGLAEAHFGVGIAHELLGREDAAAAAYREALSKSDAAGLLRTLRPVVYRALPLWERESGVGVALAAPPPYKVGVIAPDPMFKRCLDCGATALGRRTACKECGGRDFS